MSTKSTPAEKAVVVDAPKRVKLIITQVNPWSVMKVSFLLSVALGIATVVATAVLWFMLDSMQVFGSIEEFFKEANSEKLLNLLEYLRLPKVLSYSTLFALINMVIFTAISTLATILYNVVASLVGGIRITMADQ